MSKAVKIDRIVIRIGDKEIPLSLDEAKELKDILNRTFGAEKTVYTPAPLVVIERPYYPTFPTFPNYPHWYITCGDSGTATYSLSAGATNAA